MGVKKVVQLGIKLKMDLDEVRIFLSQVSEGNPGNEIGFVALRSLVQLEISQSSVEAASQALVRLKEEFVGGMPDARISTSATVAQLEGVIEKLRNRESE